MTSNPCQLDARRMPNQRTDHAHIIESSPRTIRLSCARRSSSTLICDLLKGSPIPDGDRCSLDTHPTRSLPFIQTFIDALSCCSDDVSQLTLGYMNPIGGAAERLDIGHPKQRLGESYRQLLHGD